MATPILKVMTEYCYPFIDDDNYKRMLEDDSPLFANTVWSLFRVAIPLFTLPQEMPKYLLGTPQEPNITEPKFNSHMYTTAEEHTSEFTIQLSDDYKDYELFCCRVRTVDAFGNIILSRTDIATYDPENATVTFVATADNPIPKGVSFDMDFYTDGYFHNDLSAEMMTILGYCFQVVWQTRFNNNWLSNIPKIEDRSFTEQNRANKMNADTERLRQIRTQLAQEMRRFSQNCYYRKAFPQGNLL